MLSFEEYKKNYNESINNTNKFVSNMATKLLDWDESFILGYNEDNERFFDGGKINPCYNALDRHVVKTPDKIAFIRLNNENEYKLVSYKNLYDDVLKKSYIFFKLGLKEKDVVTFYGNNSYEFFVSVLSCGRLGLVCHFIFGGFSAEIVAQRVRDTKTKLILTVDQAQRGEKMTYYSEVVFKALNIIDYRNKVLVFNFNDKSEVAKNIFYWSDLKNLSYEYTPCVSIPTDADLFIIFTSGSSGKSKGIVHNTGGFLFGTMMTIQLNFGFNGEKDIFLSTADIGWLACVSHSLYGPLLCGGTTVVLEGNPFYPHYFRIFEIISRFDITHLYTAPTVLRMIQQYVLENNIEVKNISKLYNTSSLKVIGCVGEILTESSIIFIKKLTRNDMFIINTYWQTETGTIMLSQFPVNNKNMLGVGMPVYFVKPKIVKINVMTKKLVECKPNEKGILLFSSKWPSLAKTLLNEHSRFQEVYFNIFPNFYYTGDEATKDENGNFFILGRVDDVINVSGHRLSTLEIENILSLCKGISELAVVGVPDKITGQRVCIYVVKFSQMTIDEVENNISKHLLHHFGKILGKFEIKWMNELPKTKTGKILRRLLRCQQDLSIDCNKKISGD